MEAGLSPVAELRTGSPRPPLSVGVIGAGTVACERHLPVLAADPTALVDWVADPSSEARERARRLAPGAQLAESADALLPGTDVVVVATPPAAHAEPVLAALSSGCHVLVEKPLALDLDTCDRIAEAAAASGRVVTVGFNLRHHPGVIALRDALRSGRLGAPLALRSVTSSSARLGAAPWIGEPRLGGDPLWEAGSHHADLWAHVLDSPLAGVRAVAGGDSVAVAGRSGSGVPISSSVGWGGPPLNEIEVIGDRARARASLYGSDPLEIVATDTTGAEPVQRVRRAGQLLRAVPAMAQQVRAGGSFVASYTRQWSAFTAAIRDQSPNLAPVESGRAAAEAILAIREALEAPGLTEHR